MGGPIKRKVLIGAPTAETALDLHPVIVVIKIGDDAYYVVVVCDHQSTMTVNQLNSLAGQAGRLFTEVVDLLSTVRNDCRRNARGA